MVLKFRKARVDDKKDFVQMKNDFFEHFLRMTGEKRTYSYKIWENDFNDIMSKRTTNIHIMEFGKQIVGYMIIILEKNKIKNFGYLEDIFVKKEFRSKGFGRLGVEEFIRLSKGKGVEKMGVATRVENTRANHLYKELGFEVIGYNFGQKIDYFK